MAALSAFRVLERCTGGRKMAVESQLACLGMDLKNRRDRGQGRGQGHSGPRSRSLGRGQDHLAVFGNLPLEPAMSTWQYGIFLSLELLACCSKEESESQVVVLKLLTVKKQLTLSKPLTTLKKAAGNWCPLAVNMNGV